MANGFSPQPMRIAVVNPKGGCGKTTLATNIASHYAANGFRPTIMDFDPQGSSTDWLAERDERLPKIEVVAANSCTSMGVTRAFQTRAPEGTTHLILDSAAGFDSGEIGRLIRDADVILVPLLPSTIDMRAAARYLTDLLKHPEYRRSPRPIGIIANRVREQTLTFRRLAEFLDHLGLPCITCLADTQRYVRAAETGTGLADDPSSMTRRDKKQWGALTAWLDEHLCAERATPGRLPARRVSHAQVAASQVAEAAEALRA